MEKSTEPHIIDFRKIEDPRGNLSFVEQGHYLPFDIERVYWIYDIPSWRERSGRALRTCAEVIIATSGRFSVNIISADGIEKTFVLDRSNAGLYLPPMTWRTISGFVTGSTCLTIASKLFDEADYIRDYQEYKAALDDEYVR